jgi:hypothetical protein
MSSLAQEKRQMMAELQILNKKENLSKRYYHQKRRLLNDHQETQLLVPFLILKVKTTAILHQLLCHWFFEWASS